MFLGTRMKLILRSADNYGFFLMWIVLKGFLRLGDLEMGRLGDGEVGEIFMNFSVKSIRLKKLI